MNAVYLHLLHCRFEVFTGQQSGGREQPLGYPQQLSQVSLCCPPLMNEIGFLREMQDKER